MTDDLRTATEAAAYDALKDNVPMHLLLDDIKAAFAARDATKLGPLLIAYVAATMGHFGE